MYCINVLCYKVITLCYQDNVVCYQYFTVCYQSRIVCYNMFIKVQFIISGDEDETDVRTFEDDKRKILQRGATDSFLMTCPGYFLLTVIRSWKSLFVKMHGVLILLFLNSTTIYILNLHNIEILQLKFDYVTEDH